MRKPTDRLGRVVGFCVVVAWVLAAAAQQPPARPVVREAAAEPPQVKSEVPSVRLEVTVFKVDLSKDGAVALDAKKLAAEAPTAAQMVKALQPFGAAEVLYRIDQRVAVGSGHASRIEISKSVPYVTGTTKDGSQVKSIAREEVGAKLEFEGYRPDEKNDRRIQATLRIELAVLAPSTVQTGPDVAAPLFWKITQTHAALTELGKPVVLLSVDGAAATGNERPAAFISLVTLGQPTE